MQKWLVVSNCQTFGLANCLNLLGRSIEVEAIDMRTFRLKKAAYAEKLPGYARVLIHPDLAKTDGDALTGAVGLDRIPAIQFAAYHPDIAYVGAKGARVVGPMHEYHSMLVLAAHDLGLDVRRTVSLFRGEVYERCGYLGMWTSERDAVIADFAGCGLDISQMIRRWGRAVPFMYSVNHPRIHCIFDIAKLFLEQNGIEMHAGDVLPHDNLVSGPVWPVYPEIAEIHGIRGSLAFKLPSKYRQIDLEEFVTLSLAAYAAHEPGAIRVRTGRDRYRRVKAVVAEVCG